MDEWKRPESVPFPSIWTRFQGRKIFNGTKRQYWIQDITEEYVEDVVTHMTTGCAQEEPLCKYSGLYDDKDALAEFGDVWRKLLAQKIGLICLTKNDEGDTEIAGINCTYMYLKKQNVDELEQEKSKTVYEACMFMYKTVDLFETFGVDHYVTAMGLYVPPKFRGEGIGETLLRAREHLCRAIGAKVTTTLFTSATSQILADRIGYKDIFATSYDAFLRVNKDFALPGIQEAAKNIRLMYLIYE